MARTIPLAELHADVVRLLTTLAPGEELTITHDNRPLAYIRPAAAPLSDKPRVPGFCHGKVWLADDFDAELPDASAGGGE
jgi:antitoxin (DNA-binding transcriptional repressor) of toxin-antitoxin stability system